MNKPGIDAILAASKGKPLDHRAYMLATAHHETGGTFEPVREAFGKTDAQTVSRLDKAWRDGKLSQVSVPYWRFDESGNAWFGRGFVQLTHRDNYERAGRMLNVDLLGNPSLALNKDVAAQILVRGMAEGWFTGKRLSEFQNYKSMRRVVNGNDRAEKIARLAIAYEKQLEERASIPWWRALSEFLLSIFRR